MEDFAGVLMVQYQQQMMRPLQPARTGPHQLKHTMTWQAACSVIANAVKHSARLQAACPHLDVTSLSGAHLRV